MRGRLTFVLVEQYTKSIYVRRSWHKSSAYILDASQNLELFYTSLIRYKEARPDNVSAVYLDYIIALYQIRDSKQVCAITTHYNSSKGCFDPKSTNVSSGQGRHHPSGVQMPAY